MILFDKSSYDIDIWLQRGVEKSQGVANLFGISEKNLHNWTEGELQKLVNKKVTDMAFVSCGSAKGHGFSGYIFNIYCPKGTKMMYAEPFSSYGRGAGLNWDGIAKQAGFGYEDETIIQRGTTFKVIKVEKKAATPTSILKLFPKLPEGERMNEKRPRWESEMMGGRQPNPKACETCLFRPSEFRGVKMDRADTANCQIYEEPDDKPDKVYFDGAGCESYEKAV